MYALMTRRDNTNHRRVFLFVLLVCLLSAPGSVPQADEDEEGASRAELNQLRQRIEILRREVEKTRHRHDRERDSLRDVELRISKHVRELKYIQFQLGRQDRRLGQLYHDRKRYQKDLKTQRKLLGQQIHTAYIMGQQAYLKLVLSQDDPASMGRTLKYYDYFNRSRSDLIHKARTAIERFEQNRRDIEQEKQRLASLQVYNRKKKAELETDSDQRRQMVASLNQRLEGQHRSLSSLIEDEQKLQRLVEGIGKLMPEVTHAGKGQQAFNRLKGKLDWPTSGRVQRLFGKRRGSSKASWNGVIIDAQQGKDVRAISHGRVAYADWLRGYGLLLIIDHGDGYMSLYGHNQSLLKETGDWVEAGESIASTGNTGDRTRSGLYFEIRHKGRPTNPVKWCRHSRRT